jgi:hypothetical protein
MDAGFYIAITEIVFSAEANDTKKKASAGRSPMGAPFAEVADGGGNLNVPAMVIDGVRQLDRGAPWNLSGVPF